MIQKILIVRPCAIGDLVQTLPAIRVLRKHFPSSFIEILGNPSTLVLARNRFYANSVSRFDRPDLASLFMREGALPDSVTDYLKNFDLVISYLKDDDLVFQKNIRKAGVQNIISFNPLPSNSASCNSHSDSHPFSKTDIIDHLLKPIASLGLNVNAASHYPKIYLSKDDKESANRFFKEEGLLQNVNEKILAIHPGSGSKIKNWPIEKYVETIGCLLNQPLLRIIIVCGSADEYAMSILSENIPDNRINIVKDFPLNFLAAILERTSCFLGNDGGISHIAAAVGVPSVLIYGPTNPDIWAPKGGNVRIIRGDISCSPCHLKGGNNCKNRKCLESISVDTVVKQVKTVISGQ